MAVVTRYGVSGTGRQRPYGQAATNTDSPIIRHSPVKGGYLEYDAAWRHDINLASDAVIQSASFGFSYSSLTEGAASDWYFYDGSAEFGSAGTLCNFAAWTASPAVSTSRVNAYKTGSMWVRGVLTTYGTTSSDSASVTIAVTSTYLSVTYNRPPSTPASITVPTAGQVITSGSVTLTTTGSTDPEAETITYYWEYMSGAVGWTAIGNTTALTLAWNTSALANRNDYQVRVRAIDLAGSNTYSAYLTSSAFTIQNTQILSPGSIASAQAFGNPTVVPGPRVLQPGSIASIEAFGNPTLQAIINLLPAAIASAEAFGLPQLDQVYRINPEAIASAEAVGQPTIIPGATSVGPEAIASGEAIGQPTIQTTISVIPAGIASSETFGNPTVLAVIVVGPQGIATSEAFGNATVYALITVSPQAIASAEAFGQPTIQATISVSPAAIASAEALGAPVVIPGEVRIIPTGIASQETFGIAFIVPPGIPWIFEEGSEELLILVEMPEIELVSNAGWIEVLGTDEHIETEEN